ncbi:MAG: hypothetical protein OMM_10023 [Candidatus Magnetoglobus multicellularis str. Araruama]|uniref:Uncharacterized protein n=1 Tax=Candidatus Magnetoglobus multicellularis str. Araruama TaxID=890399 RepID=A0A1V1P245_9BACT|nr:MAG: hypothetical protein OMM_10023 [Candidatus Magnetoglobus multicellularis str. Araruama]
MSSKKILWIPNRKMKYIIQCKIAYFFYFSYFVYISLLTIWALGDIDSCIIKHEIMPGFSNKNPSMQNFGKAATAWG